jgi:hypothetical protein
MKLEGSCHCGAVRFEVDSPHPYPFNRCYCSACRKTAGTGGFAINLGGEAETLRVTGSEHVRVYRPGHIDEHDRKPSPQERHFCGHCGTALWIQDPRWPELVHPHAGAVDTELPVPPDRNHLMLDFKPSWVPVHADPQDRHFARYPDESIAKWHESRGLSS